MNHSRWQPSSSRRSARARASARASPAEALAEPGRDARAAVHEAAEATEALARRLTDSLPPKEQVAALARAQRTLDRPDAPINPADLARQQRAIAEDLARLRLSLPKLLPFLVTADHRPRGNLLDRPDLRRLVAPKASAFGALARPAAAQLALL